MATCMEATEGSARPVTGDRETLKLPFSSWPAQKRPLHQLDVREEARPPSSLPSPPAHVTPSLQVDSDPRWTVTPAPRQGPERAAPQTLSPRAPLRFWPHVGASAWAACRELLHPRGYPAALLIALTTVDSLLDAAGRLQPPHLGPCVLALTRAAICPQEVTCPPHPGDRWAKCCSRRGASGKRRDVSSGSPYPPVRPQVQPPAGGMVACPKRGAQEETPLLRESMSGPAVQHKHENQDEGGRPPHTFPEGGTAEAGAQGPTHAAPAMLLRRVRICDLMRPGVGGPVGGATSPKRSLPHSPGSPCPRKPGSSLCPPRVLVVPKAWLVQQGAWPGVRQVRVAWPGGVQRGDSSRGHAGVRNARSPHSDVLWTPRSSQP